MFYCIVRSSSRFFCWVFGCALRVGVLLFLGDGQHISKLLDGYVVPEKQTYNGMNCIQSQGVAVEMECQ